MGLLEKILSKKIINTNGYTRSDTGKAVHSYLRTHPKNQGITKKVTRTIINELKKKWWGREMTDGFPYVVWYCDYYEDYLSELSCFDNHKYVCQCIECGQKIAF